MKIYRMNWFLRIITLNRVVAITLAPFGIYFKGPTTGTNLRHEEIHWKQQMEMLIIPFYLWYLIEWIIRLFINGGAAYINLSFEREAYGHQYDTNYLQERKRFAWIRYIKKT